jgi:COMPASS component SWD3
MSDFGDATPGQSAKRRKLRDDDGSASPDQRYSSPDSQRDRGLTIRSGRPPSQSPSRSRSRSYASSRSSSRSRSESHSRSRSRSRTRTDSRSRSRSTRSSSSRRRRSPSGRSPGRGVPVRPNYTAQYEIQAHPQPISQVRISPNGRFIVSASADGVARVWNAEDGTHMASLVGHMAGISCLAWAPDSSCLATGSDDKAIRLWERVTGDPAHASTTGPRRLDGSSVRGSRRPLLGHHNYVYCLAFSPKGNILASGSYDEAVFLWDVRAGRLMRSLPAHSDPVSGIDFSRDGTLVVSCSTDGLM